MSTPPPSDPWSRRVVVRGATGYVELGEAELLYRHRLDGPPLQRIPFDSISRLITSRSGDTFDVVTAGARDRARPSLFSETSMRRDPRTATAEWQRFLAELARAIDDARRSES